MCTVTFLPLPDGGYLLGTNRDESHRRTEARTPAVRTLAGRPVLAPLDGDAGGTWIAADELGRSLCILNGDRPPASPVEAGAPSRGLLVLALMADPSAAAVRSALYERLRRGHLREKPFKLLVAEPGSGGAPARISRVDWDGRRLTAGESDGPTLAVSSTFDTDGVAAYRSRAFAALRAAVLWPEAERLRRHGEERGTATAPPRLDVDALAALQHRWHASHAEHAAEGDAYSVCMHREDARTVSCTLVRVGPRRVAMRYQPGHPCAGAPLVEASLGEV